MARNTQELQKTNIDCNRYWTDENNNRWDHTEKQAQEKSESLVNCYDCYNCSDCRYCRYCSDCSDCCSNSRNCDDHKNYSYGKY